MCKKTIFTIALQVVIIGVFVLIAAGSGSERVATVSRAAYQGGTCGSRGYTFLGYYSNSDCPDACAEAGYSNYCTGDATTACFCK